MPQKSKTFRTIPHLLRLCAIRLYPRGPRYCVSLTAYISVFSSHTTFLKNVVARPARRGGRGRLRDGRVERLPATRLVPGDVVRIEAGDRVPADGTLVEAQGVSVDESVLT